ncbi:MAG: 5'/3'-nucleotidase SurE [Deltaproteobacteria bacterium]|nr:5'/3'-nucleotidase SurE [Deltaproteobacteria bacterium]
MTKKILLCNDDGFDAVGIKELEAGLAGLGELTVVAPDREQSASGHSLTLQHPLRIDERSPCHYAVDGTPTDCVFLGINHIMKAHRPDLVVSGINRGGNLGDDITYSGTVAAAFEATLLGVPALAVSLEITREHHFATASRAAREVALKVFAHGLPAATLLNVNVPDLPWEKLAGFRITRQGKRSYSDVVRENVDPRGRHYYWIGGEVLPGEDLDGTDAALVRSGFVSITPIQLDLTNHRALELLGNWEWSC